MVAVGYPTEQGRAGDELVGVFAHGDLLVAAVADGGVQQGGGDVAAALTLRTLAEVLQGASPSPAEALSEGIRLANRVLFDGGRGRPAAAGSAVSVAAVAIRGDAAAVAHVGDARVTLIRDGDARPLTRDHTLEALLQGGSPATPPTPDAAPDERLARALGRDREVRIDVLPGFTLHEGDVLVLSTATSRALWSHDAARLVAGDAPAVAAALRSRVVAAAPGAEPALVVLRVGKTPGASLGPTAVPDVERPADLLTPSTADLQLVARLSGAPSAVPAGPRLSLPPPPDRAAAASGPASGPAPTPPSALSPVTLGLIAGLLVLTVLLLIALLVG